MWFIQKIRQFFLNYLNRHETLHIIICTFNTYLRVLDLVCIKSEELNMNRNENNDENNKRKTVEHNGLNLVRKF